MTQDAHRVSNCDFDVRSNLNSMFAFYSKHGKAYSLGYSMVDGKWKPALISCDLESARVEVHQTLTEI